MDFTQTSRKVHVPDDTATHVHAGFFIEERNMSPAAILKSLPFSVVISAAGLAAEAATIDLQSTASGNYLSNGIAIGNILEGQPRNNYFVFDLTTIVGEVASATLTIFASGGYQTSLASVDFGLYDVSTDIPTLTDGDGGTAAYADLGSGTSYGATIIATPGTFGDMPKVTISLNADGLFALKSAPGLFAVGGSGNLANSNESLWRFTSADAMAAQLSIETTIPPVPLPAGLPLLAVGLGALGFASRRRKSA